MLSSANSMNGQPVHFADSIRYMGLPDLSWSKNITSKARQLVGLLFWQS